VSACKARYRVFAAICQKRNSEMKMPSMFNRTQTKPLAVPRTVRAHDLRLLTSIPAGKMVPLAAVPLLREDALQNGAFSFQFEMSETVEVLLNAVNVRLLAYLVPNLALERFGGSMDRLNLSYEGLPEREGDAVVPFIETEAFGAPLANPIYYYMGKHGRADQQVNTAYVEAYNQIWNFRAKNRSPDIALRTRLQNTLAPAFWTHQHFAHIVPDFDQASMDGNVSLNVVNSRMPIRGMAVGTRGAAASNTGVDTEGQTVTFPKSWAIQSPGTVPSAGQAHWIMNANNAGFPDIFAEMQENGITVSLANIDLARKTQAFARLREQYKGLSDDHIINLLMDGIHIPDQGMKQPILLADVTTQFGMVKRYASDAANLTESVVNGATVLNVNVRTPRVGVGGVVMIVAEVTPDQLFERQPDPYLHITDVDRLPQYLRDELDPEKVEVVKNEQIDLDHDTPNATFGYAPLNWVWNHHVPSIGGKFYRPAVDSSFDEDRQRLWAVETQNPVLSTDFYVVSGIHLKPFVDQNSDPFEVVGRGIAAISGNTVFGMNLLEANGAYEEVLAEAPQERIEK